MLLSDSDFGRLPISDRMRPRYLRAIQAGLGHAGRHGRLITWNEGPMVRIAKIFTDLPLAPSPMAPEGIIEYCEVCKKCAKHCPSQSIPLGPRTFEGHTEANNPGI